MTCFHVQLFSLLVAISLGGCATVITPPASPQSPVTVFVPDRGKHAGLIMPTDDDRFVEYNYGEWRYYALAKEDPFHSIAALCWPTPGALGRRYLTTVEVADRANWKECEVVHDVIVSRELMHRLRSELDGRFQRNKHLMVHRADIAIDMVPHDESYTLVHTCNHELVEWLVELGCTVEKTGPVANLKFKPAASASH